MPVEAPYERIARSIRDRITSGDLAPGRMAPSGPEIMRDYDVAKATAGRVSSLLRSWGLVETVTGVGTRVVERPPASGPAEHSDRVQRGLPIYAPGERSEIIEASVITTDVVDLDVVRALDLPVSDLAGEATTVVKRSRRLYRREDVVGLCRTWYPHPLIVQQGRRGTEVVERLTSTDRIPGGTARLLLDLYGLDEITHTSTRAGVRRLPPALARDLAVDPGTPALWLLETRLSGEYVIECDEWFRFDDVVLS